MAVVVVTEIEGGSQDLYEQVSPRAMPDGKLPEGCTLHIAGPIDAGWRVITVWDSEDQFQQFREERLIPALRDSGAEERVAPRIQADPVYKLILS
jgi:hypothetical protein